MLFIVTHKIPAWARVRSTTDEKSVHTGSSSCRTASTKPFEHSLARHDGKSALLGEKFSITLRKSKNENRNEVTAIRSASIRVASTYGRARWRRLYKRWPNWQEWIALHATTWAIGAAPTWTEQKAAGIQSEERYRLSHRLSTLSVEANPPTSVSWEGVSILAKRRHLLCPRRGLLGIWSAIIAGQWPSSTDDRLFLRSVGRTNILCSASLDGFTYSAAGSLAKPRSIVTTLRQSLSLTPT
jgi:hypothetical protein